MKTLCRLQKMSIGFSVLLWLIFVAVSLVSIPKAGATVIAALVMDVVLTVGLSIDVFATCAFGKKKPGCLCASYFVVWGLSAIICIPSLIGMPIMAIIDPKETWWAAVTAFLGMAMFTAIPVSKIMVGVILIKRSKQASSEIQQNTPPLSPEGTLSGGIDIFPAKRPTFLPVMRFYSVLIVLKTIYALYQSFSAYQLMYQHGLFSYNSRWGFIISQIMRLVFGLVPYIAFGLCTALISRFMVLSVCTGMAVAFSDVYVDYYLRNETDAQTPIAMMYMYSFLLVCILCLFLVLNYGIGLVVKKGKQDKKSGTPF